MNANKKSTLLIVAGPNGGGKSTLRESLLKQILKSGLDLPNIVIDPDAITREVRNAALHFSDTGVGNMVLDALKKVSEKESKTGNTQALLERVLQGSQSEIDAGRLAVIATELCIQKQISFCLETTLSGKSVLNHMAQAIEHNFHINFAYIALPSPQDHIDRVRQRVSEGGHNIPEEDIVRRYMRSLDNLPHAMAQANEVKLYTNNIEGELLLHINDGQILYQAQHMPPWAEKALQEYQTLSQHKEKTQQNIQNDLGPSIDLT